MNDVNAPLDYTGDRTKESILNWVRKRELAAVSALDNLDDITKFINDHELVMIAHVNERSENEEPRDDDLHAIIDTVADRFRDVYVTGLITNNELAPEGCSIPCIAVYTKFNDKKPSFLNASASTEPLETTTDETEDSETEDSISESETEGSRAEGLSLRDIEHFLRVERFPPIDSIGPNNYQDYIDMDLPIVWIAIKPNDTANKSKVIQSLTPFAVDQKGKLSFVLVDADRFAGHVENLGIDQIPGFLIIVEDTNEKYKY
eukprot:UN29350